MNVSRKRRAPGPTSTTSGATAGHHRLRIIGGRWRSTPLHFPDVAAIRPTPNRVRETLFNWLQQAVLGARCLDLFAGSGAVGLEALSRGAGAAVFVDMDAVIGRYLRDTLERLRCTDAQVVTADARNYLQRAPTAFDIVFLDPPFAAGVNELLPQLIQQLEHGGWLAPEAWIYLECPAGIDPLSIEHWPHNWRLHRSKQAGQVGYHLAQRSVAKSA